MNRETLEKKCIERFGEPNGKRLFKTMIEIANKDFCVATAWKANQVSISKSCKVRGKIFTLTEDYKEVIFPDNRKAPIRSLTYYDISRYLPQNNIYSEIKHCKFDS